MNLPNRLTILRMILAVLFAVSLAYPNIAMRLVSLALFVSAALTDYYDGKIARATNQVTSLGRLMDPIADKTLSFCAFFGFVWLAIMPLWMALLIVLREIFVTGIRLRMSASSPRTGAIRSGKQKTVAQFTATILVLLYLVTRESAVWNPQWDPALRGGIVWMMAFVVGITLWSGVDYWLSSRRGAVSGRADR